MTHASRASGDAWSSVRVTRRRPAVMVLAAALLLVSRTVHAADGEDDRTRGEWAAILVAYTALSALTVGSAYVMRDNFLGQSAAVGAAGSGGLVLGAAAGAGLARLRSCRGPDCEMEEAAPVLLGGLLGAVASGVAATILTLTPGMSRPKVAAVGVAPAMVFLGLGTIFCW
jgi:hypothetical protein